MIKGFLGTPAPLMMDLIVVSLVLIVPLLAYSISLAKKGQRVLHKKIQTVLSIVLLIAVLLFEVQMKLSGGIANIMEAERYTVPFRIYLWTHIAISIFTILLWIITIVGAYRHFHGDQMDSDYIPSHRRKGWMSTFALLLTSVTGLGVYYWCFL